MTTERPVGLDSRRATVVLKAVDVRIAGKTILRDVDWTLADGTSWAVVGENGSGKTSLLRVVAGRLWPAPGGFRRYDFGGGWETDAVAALRHIALITPADEERYLAHDWNFPTLRVVHSGLTGTRTPRVPARRLENLKAQRALRRFGIAHLANRGFLELSRGERRRALLARALVREPRILILDEGAAGLDAQSRSALWETLRQLSRRIAIVTSHHDVHEIPPWIGKAAQVRAGRLSLLATAAAGTAAPPPKSRGKPSGLRRSAAPWTIRLSRATFFLEGRAVLRDVNWSLRAEEQWHITGTNGSGKTTLLRALNGEIHPARGGRIEWRGFQASAGRAQLQAGIGFVGPELEWRYRYPTTVWDCVFSGLTGSIGVVRRPTKSESKRVGTTVERFQLEALVDHRISELSYGQRRWVMIARAVVKRPRWLLLDEPTEGLDEEQTRRLLELLKDVAEGGCQVICASHLDLAPGWFTDTLELAAGRTSSETYS